MIQHFSFFCLWSLFILFFFADRMKIDDIKMATPIEEKMDQNLKVSLHYLLIAFSHPSSVKILLLKAHK